MVELPECIHRGQEVSPGIVECASDRIIHPSAGRASVRTCLDCSVKLRETPNSVLPTKQEPFLGKNVHESRHTCKHRGGVSRHVDCQSCSGHVQLKVFNCDKKGECVLGQKTTNGIQKCLDCPSFESNRDAYPERLYAHADRLYPPIPYVDPSTFQTRNVLYHIYPRNHDVWTWNLSQLIHRLPLFNGRRIMAIVTDENTQPAADVKRFMHGTEFEFLEFENNPELREVISHLRLVQSVASRRKDEVTFYAHGKGVWRDKPVSKWWAEAMYETLLDDWDQVAEQLAGHAMAGSFRRFGDFTENQSAGGHGWHFAGTFYWWRHDVLYSRDWQKIDQQWYGNEAWPGKMFRWDETACVFADDINDPYDVQYWKNVLNKELGAWKRKNSQSR